MNEDLAAYFFRVLTCKNPPPQAFKNPGLSAEAAPAEAVKTEAVKTEAEKVDEADPPVTEALTSELPVAESSKTSSSEGKVG